MCESFTSVYKLNHKYTCIGKNKLKKKIWW